MRLNRDYLSRSGSVEFAEKIIANSLANLPAVRVEEIIKGRWDTGFYDTTYISRLILGKCVRRSAAQQWTFNPAAFIEQDQTLRVSGIRCEDYGHVSNNKKFQINRKKIWEMLASQTSADFAKAKTKEYLDIK